MRTRWIAAKWRKVPRWAKTAVVTGAASGAVAAIVASATVKKVGTDLFEKIEKEL